MSVFFVSSFYLALYFIYSWRYYVIICGINNMKFTHVAVCSWELFIIIFLLKFYCEKSDEVGSVILVLKRLRQQEHEFQSILSYIVNPSQPVVHRRPNYKKTNKQTLFLHCRQSLFHYWVLSCFQSKVIMNKAFCVFQCTSAVCFF